MSESPSPAASEADCTLWQIAVAIVINPGRHGMNQVYYPVEFTNASSEPCVLTDPEFALTTTRAEASVIGAPTSAGVHPPTRVPLAPGAVASTTLVSVNPDVLDPAVCRRVSPLKVHWLQVVLHGQDGGGGPFDALYAPFTPETDVCANGRSISVYPLVPGARSPY